MKSKKTKKDEQIHVPNCFICLDRGFVLYRKKVGEYTGEYVAHCTCQRGQSFNYDGTQCEHQSGYRIPCIAEITDQYSVATKNFSRWKEKNKNKKGFKAAMRKLGMKANAS